MAADLSPQKDASSSKRAAFCSGRPNSTRGDGSFILVVSAIAARCRPYRTRWKAHCPTSGNERLSCSPTGDFHLWLLLFFSFGLFPQSPLADRQDSEREPRSMETITKTPLSGNSSSFLTVFQHMLRWHFCIALVSIAWLTMTHFISVTLIKVSSLNVVHFTSCRQMPFQCVHSKEFWFLLYTVLLS